LLESLDRKADDGLSFSVIIAHSAERQASPNTVHLKTF
jgi:hypothetical protein